MEKFNIQFAAEAQESEIHALKSADWEAADKLDNIFRNSPKLKNGQA